MKKYLSLFVITALLSGCSSFSNSIDKEIDATALVLAEPLQVNYQTEIMLMRYSQLIFDAKEDTSRQARYFYERGLLADSMGLRSLAHADFQRAVNLQPDFVPAYNFIGLYMTQTEQFDEAYDAYDSVEQLEPENGYVALNRGIALYYGERYSLAITDLTAAYADKPNDPFRTLWAYYPEHELAPEQAAEELSRRFEQRVDDNWSWNIVALYGQQLTEKQLLAKVKDELDPKAAEYNKLLAQRLTEVYFYLGKLKLLQGKKALANTYFKLSLANNVYEFIEHGYARLELQRLKNQ